MEFIYKIRGEKWSFYRTDVLKNFPFKEFKGEKFIIESTVWHEISKYYQTRHINEILRIYKIGEDSLSNSIINLRLNNPQGTYYTYKKRLELKMPFVEKLRCMINCGRYSNLKNRSFLDCINRLGIFSIFIIPSALILKIRDNFIR